MIAQELSDHFRRDVADSGPTKLWSKEEVLLYISDAYFMFVRLTGGIPDFTSPATRVPIVAGDAVGKLHPSILRINQAQRESDGGIIQIVNYTDLAKLSVSVFDYGQFQSLKLDSQPGPVRYGVIGMQRDTIRWLKVPLIDDTANLIIHRMPFSPITDFEQALEDVEDHHHIHLVTWMKHLAYSKQDTDAFDAQKAEEYKRNFERYCTFVREEKDRYKSKVRTTGYGGI